MNIGNRRLGVGALAVLLLASCMTTLKPATQPTQAAPSGTGHTVVTIVGTNFLINGELTSPGKPAQGLLLNTRMAQAIFDDANTATAGEWKYPDTGTWDPQRNTNELVAMLPTYAQHGIRMITVGLQGGCPSTSPPCPGGDHEWNVSAFNADGSLKTAWMNRLKQVITAADHNGIVVMVQFFYHGQNQRVNDPDLTTAQSAAVNNITDWLVNGGYTNVLVETANECDAGYSAYLDGGNCANEANVVKQVQDRSGGKLRVSVSWKGGEQPSDEVIKQEDFILLHGNGIDGTQLQALIASTKNSPAYKASPKPIVVNEDSTSTANLDASVASGVSWGYLDTGQNNYVDGFQRVPVNWAINTDAKKAFFAETLKLAGPVVTSFVFGGPATADFNDPLTLAATLTDVWGNPLADSGVTFGLGSQTCSAVTGANGEAACGVVPTAAAGNTSLTISYAGNDQFQARTTTVPFVIAHEQTALAYRGDSALVNGVGAHLSAVLTEDGTAPLAGQSVSLALGSGASRQTCSALTDAGGLASCSLAATSQPLGAGTVTASFAGDRFYAASVTSADVDVTAVKSGLTYTGPASGDFNDPITLTAGLRAGEAALAGASLTFTLGTQTCTGQTDAQGVASCALTPKAAAGNASLSVRYAGTDLFQASSTTVPFVIAAEQTALAYLGDTALVNGVAAHLSAVLTEDGTTALSGEAVSLALGSGASRQTCTAATDANGLVSCSPGATNQPLGGGGVTASFNGDQFYAASVTGADVNVTAARTALTYTGPASGDFNDPITLTAGLSAGESAVAGASLTFTLGSQACTGQTDAHGAASCTLTPNAAAGNASLSITYAGNDQFQAASATAPFVIGHEQTALAYQGDAALVNGVAAHLSAVLTEDGSTPLAGRSVTLGFGSSSAQTCSAVTNANGLASCSPGATNQPLGGGSVTASFAGDRFYTASATSADVDVTAVRSGLTYTGPVSGDFNDSITLTAGLSAGEAAVSGASLTFTLGSQSCTGQTDAHGVASCTLTPNAAAGAYSLAVTFAGNTNFQASTGSTSFTVTKEETRLAYTGDTVLVNGSAAHLSATLTEDGSTALMGRSLTLGFGSASSAQTCTAVTDAAGSAACSIASVNQPVGAGVATATFAGDEHSRSASDQPATQVSGAAVTPAPSPSAPPTLATTGQAAPISPLPAITAGALLLIVGLLLLALPRRRAGEPPSIVWRNRE